MNTIFYHPTTADQALINPTDTVQPVAHFPEVCISTFSKQIIDQFSSFGHVETVVLLERKG